VKNERKRGDLSGNIAKRAPRGVGKHAMCKGLGGGVGKKREKRVLVPGAHKAKGAADHKGGKFKRKRIK